MLRLIQIAIASLGMLGCGVPPAADRPSATEYPGSGGDPASPSAPVARFTGQEPGAPDVGPVRLHVREAGKISLPNGRLAVSDAFINDAPLTLSDLPAGEYPVDLLVAASDSDAGVAAARIRFGTEPPARWRRVGYFGVDSGNGAFFDPRVSSTLEPSHIDTFNDTLMKALDESYHHTYSTANLSWQGMTFVAFSTGWGDGSYPVYVGLSTAGSAVSVLIDCEILPW